MMHTAIVMKPACKCEMVLPRFLLRLLGGHGAFGVPRLAATGGIEGDRDRLLLRSTGGDLGLDISTDRLAARAFLQGHYLPRLALFLPVLLAELPRILLALALICARSDGEAKRLA